MGFLGLGNKKMRGSTRTGTERLAAEKAREQRLYNRWLQGLQTRNDPRFDDLMLRHSGFNTDSRDPVAGLVKTLKMLRDAELIDDPKRAGISGDLAKAAEALGPVLQQFMGGAAPPMQRAQLQVPAGYKLVPIETTSSTVAPIEAATPTEALAAPSEQVAVEQVPLSPISAQVINILSGMTPQQGAEWLTQQKAKFADWLVSAICMTPDDKLPELLLHLSGEVPDFAGVIDWMSARPGWRSAFVQAVRALKQKWPQQVASSA